MLKTLKWNLSSFLVSRKFYTVRKAFTGITQQHSNFNTPVDIYTQSTGQKQVHLRYPSVYKPRTSIKFRLSSYRILYTASLKQRMLLGYIYITIALRNNLVYRKPFMAEITKDCQTYADRRFLKSTRFLRAFFKIIQ